MTDLTNKFAADHAATWSHTDKDVVCVGYDTSDDDNAETETES